ncbi:putative mRNA (guanine-N(7))-methyltransferase [Helianthus annuus]|nr:putative mRNA (guanine-N(7))-methyltransferase [Helianthus annuus]KAJ0531718.1 putative mRNA (guanine-N(7))-methyltransferase [Helianthus annuus]KAJ0701915.1 putative mRNA (guanine-N(7))-methyltransferase [Helianthus annuus]
MRVSLDGDLIKWDKAKIGYHVGIDVAEGSNFYGSGCMYGLKTLVWVESMKTSVRKVIAYVFLLL